MRAGSQLSRLPRKCCSRTSGISPAPMSRYAYSIPFSAVHRLLPLGVFGVVMNVFSGMLLLLADSFRYLNANTSAPKVAFITIGAIAVLYYSVSNGLWNVKAGEDAPMSAKWVATVVLLSWAGVIMGGRLIPYV